MFQINNLFNNKNIQCVSQMGQFFVCEHQKDLSVSPYNAETAYFSSEMNVKRRQVLVQLNNTGCFIQAGAMQWMLGNVNMKTNVTAGNFLGKAASAMVTKETIAKSEYTGQGYLMLEPTYKHIILIDVSKWGQIVLDDGLFLACDNTLQYKTVSRKNLSSAVLGGEGLFNLSLIGNGIAALESPVPQQELIQFNLQDDEVKIDGKQIELSFKEFELLTYFVTNQGVALSRERILNNVWNYDYFGDARTIDTHVKKLRSKLGEKGEYIKTIWGMGYKFEVS